MFERINDRPFGLVGARLGPSEPVGVGRGPSWPVGACPGRSARRSLLGPVRTRWGSTGSKYICTCMSSSTRMFIGVDHFDDNIVQQLRIRRNQKGHDCGVPRRLFYFEHRLRHDPSPQPQTKTMYMMLERINEEPVGTRWDPCARRGPSCPVAARPCPSGPVEARRCPLGAVGARWGLSGRVGAVGARQSPSGLVGAHQGAE